MSATIRLGHRMKLFGPGNASKGLYQNWWVGKNIDGYTFLPCFYAFEVKKWG